ncbi:hypothetical protein BpHYR1_034270 [Brachionus plicatilis]|uniref:Uncharacterized protein n=1 Tax=Brachionus plicatilis TaxID=10195 RepID=A0A3M7R4C7_BRAPC|nr:hypothetical protein BpHYR1_034270 [Brachionus plicatilis]
MARVNLSLDVKCVRGGQLMQNYALAIFFYFLEFSKLCELFAIDTILSLDQFLNRLLFKNQHTKHWHCK